jgi:hypothetical protein
MRSFSYQRESIIFKKDEKGVKIPLTAEVTDENGVATKQVVPGKFETESVWVEDYFNLENYVRAVTIENGSIVIMLNDGHEESREVPILKNDKKPASLANIKMERQRQYVCSEIVISKPEDIERIRTILK